MREIMGSRGAFVKIYWIFIVIAIVCAVCSDKIDRAVKANKKVKKVVLLLCGVLLLISIFSIGKATFGAKEIGTISGAENEYITIDGVEYVFDIDSGYSYADKGKYLGKVSNSKITMKVYSVEGDTNGDYIYTRWD